MQRAVKTYNSKTRKLWLIFFWLLVCSVELVSPQSFASKLVAAEETKKNEPAPYRSEEFAPVFHDLRRFEVILLGTLPLTLLFGGLIYDITNSALDPNITEFAAPATGSDNVLHKIGIGISISGILALIDLGINKGKQYRQRKAREKVYNYSGIGEGSPPQTQSSRELEQGAKQEQEPEPGQEQSQGRAILSD